MGAHFVEHLFAPCEANLVCPAALRRGCAGEHCRVLAEQARNAFCGLRRLWHQGGAYPLLCHEQRGTGDLHGERCPGALPLCGRAGTV